MRAFAVGLLAVSCVHAEKAKEEKVGTVIGIDLGTTYVFLQPCVCLMRKATCPDPLRPFICCEAT